MFSQSFHAYTAFDDGLGEMRKQTRYQQTQSQSRRVPSPRSAWSRLAEEDGSLIPLSSFQRRQSLNVSDAKSPFSGSSRVLPAAPVLATEEGDLAFEDLRNAAPSNTGASEEGPLSGGVWEETFAFLGEGAAAARPQEVSLQSDSVSRSEGLSHARAESSEWTAETSSVSWKEQDEWLDSRFDCDFVGSRLEEGDARGNPQNAPRLTEQQLAEQWARASHAVAESARQQPPRLGFEYESL